MPAFLPKHRGVAPRISAVLEPAPAFRWVRALPVVQRSIGHAALDVAIANFSSERFTLCNRALVIREHKPKVRK
jgi:hypothetical protein